MEGPGETERRITSRSGVEPGSEKIVDVLIQPRHRFGQKQRESYSGHVPASMGSRYQFEMVMTVVQSQPGTGADNAPSHLG